MKSVENMNSIVWRGSRSGVYEELRDTYPGEKVKIEGILRFKPQGGTF